jgi:ESS family glutamate:Na+ symporter
VGDAKAVLIAIPDFPALTIGIIVFFLGAFLTRQIAFLRNYNIPEPVSGGLAVALVAWAVFAWLDVEISYDTSTRDRLLVIFFTTIGLNARFSDLVAGGRMLAILLVLTVVFIVIQNGVGLLGASVFDLPSSVSVLLGSASLIGGHGTAIAWGPTIAEESSFAGAVEIGIAAATLGLVCAALLGGPVAKFLIESKRLEPAETDGPIVGLPFSEKNDEDGEGVNHISLMRALLAANVAVILGYFANQAIAEAGLKLPLFVPCLIVAILMSNTIPVLFPRLPWPARTRALAVISDYSLSIFLAMSLMSMQLWTLAGDLPRDVADEHAALDAGGSWRPTHRSIGFSGRRRDSIHPPDHFPLYGLGLYGGGPERRLCRFRIGRNADSNCQYVGGHETLRPSPIGVHHLAVGLGFFCRSRERVHHSVLCGALATNSMSIVSMTPRIR